MEVVVTTGAIRRAKLQSNRQHQQSSFFTSLSVTQSQQSLSTEGKVRVPFIWQNSQGKKCEIKGKMWTLLIIQYQCHLVSLRCFLPPV